MCCRKRVRHLFFFRTWSKPPSRNVIMDMIEIYVDKVYIQSSIAIGWPHYHIFHRITSIIIFLMFVKGSQPRNTWGPKLTIFFGHMAEVAKRSKKTCRIQQNPKRPKKMAGTRNMDFLRFPWVLFQGPNCRPHWHWAQWEIKDIRAKGLRKHDVNPKSLCTQSRWRTYWRWPPKIWDEHVGWYRKANSIHV